MYQRSSNTEQNVCYVHATLAMGDLFATEQIMAQQTVTVTEPLDEEALHALFEQAISDRLKALSEQLRLVSASRTSRLPESVVQYIFQPEIAPSIVTIKPQTGIRGSAWMGQAWKRRITSAGLALLLIM